MVYRSYWFIQQRAILTSLLVVLNDISQLVGQVSVLVILDGTNLNKYKKTWRMEQKERKRRKEIEREKREREIN